MSQIFLANFGSGKTGLTTVGYGLYDSTNTASGSRITAGVFEVGGGVYGAAVTLPSATFTGLIKWDTGETTPIYASEPVNPTSLAPNGLDAIMVETGVNARQAFSPMLAALAGVITGQQSGTVVVQGGNVTTTRITAVTDTNNNRTAVTLNLPK